MKKVLSVIAVSAFVLTAGVALAGGPGKKMDAGCPEACQQQIDDLNSSQAQQNEQLGAHGKTLENHEGRITTLEKDAYDPWYVRVGARAAWMTQDVGVAGFTAVDEWDTDMGWGGALAFGREFGQFRAEVEVAYQTADLDDLNRLDSGLDTLGYDSLALTGDQSVLTVMANAYYEIPVYDNFSVYVMAGMGFAKYDMDISLTGTDYYDDGGDVDYTDNILSNHNMGDNVFAYKAGLGMTYNFTDQIAGDLGYEYLGVADSDVIESISGHNIVASVRFKF